MRVIIVFSVAAVLASSQPRDAAFKVLDRAYQALRARDYDTAVPAFLQAIQASARFGRAVPIDPVPRPTRPDMGQEIRIPAHALPQLVDVEQPQK